MWREICEDPALIPNAVEECLRHNGSVAAWRRLVTRDTEVGGIPIAAGSKLLIVTASANHDEAHFADADLFDIRRDNAAGAEVAKQACIAAREAQKTWWSLTHAARGRILYAVAANVRAHNEPLAMLESMSQGKPIRDSRREVEMVAEMFEFYAGWSDKFYGHVIPVPTTHLNYTRREPFGTILHIAPWNIPILSFGWQVAPTIAVGNAVLLKPSELTPFTSLAVAALAEQAGVPVGLINVLAGYGHTTAQAAIADDVVKKVVFVGSPATGIRIAEAAARRVIPCILELGGKSANIVFDDANLDLAAIGAQAAVFSGAGQSCTAGSRLLIQRKVYEQVVDKVAEGARKLRLGHPLGYVLDKRVPGHPCRLAIRRLQAQRLRAYQRH